MAFLTDWSIYKNAFLDIEDITWPRGQIRNFISERSERVKYFFNTRRENSYLQAAM